MHHEAGRDGVLACCSCGRLQSVAGPAFASVGDGRDLCLECVSSVVVDTRDAQPLYNEVLRFYRSMGMEHPHRAPMVLVDSPTLQQHSQQEGRHDVGPIFHVRGLCVATVYRAIPSIVRSSLPRGGGVSVSQVATPMHDRSTTSCSVSAILVMYGLPRLLTGAILAHELMHAWLRMRNVAGIEPQVEEGLCQLMAVLWLDKEHNALVGDDMQQRLNSYFAYQIRQDQSEVYGDGFRIAYDAFQRGGGGMRGLAGVVNSVLRTGRLQ